MEPDHTRGTNALQHGSGRSRCELADLAVSPAGVGGLRDDWRPPADRRARSGATPVLVAATTAGSLSLIAALAWRSQLIEAWRNQNAKPTRQW